MSWSSSSPEGCFAINKPPAISSAQVIRDVQARFNPSKLFSPWIRNEEARLERESHIKSRRRRRNRPQQLKMGHGGTLDPMATGVLILGVASGTKSLANFLACTKSYEAVLLFGKATDSYDTEGKVVAKKAFDHVTKEMVEEALAKFRGQIMQKPPIFSALRVQGKRLYEYAREGKEVPIEIEERPVEVKELELTEWMPGGTHSYNWPEAEADKAEKVFADKILHLEAETTPEPQALAEGASAEPAAETGAVDSTAGDKRKRDNETVVGAIEPEVPRSPKRQKSTSEPIASGALPDTNAANKEAATESTKREPCPAPACHLRMTVTSGFYVRSLCHDLGTAVGSLGIMAGLVRTRQGDFELGKNVFEYEDLAKGEEHWAPQVTKMLEEWTEKEPQGRPDVLPPRREESDKGSNGDSRGKKRQEANYAMDGPRRNSSSDDE